MTRSAQTSPAPKIILIFNNCDIARMAIKIQDIQRLKMDFEPHMSILFIHRVDIITDNN
jgi:hypothetical protein